MNSSDKITDKAQLTDYIASGCKPEEAWRIDTEHEKFAFDLETLKGDNRKATKKLGWKPKVKFKKLVKIMVEEDLSRWERWLKGEQFPWDAAMAEQDISAKHK